VRETGGRFVSVTDEAILEAMRLLPKASAVTAEPAGATGFAGLVKLVGEGLVRADEQVVVVVTGSGLKDVDSSVRAGGRPETIEPSMEGLKSAMAGS
jgi:threonine synthase